MRVGWSELNEETRRSVVRANEGQTRWARREDEFGLRLRISAVCATFELRVVAHLSVRAPVVKWARSNCRITGLLQKN